MILKCFVGLLFLYYGVWSLPSKQLLGSKECTWGPSYWCKNITAAKNCNAVKHCIQTVWEYQTVPEDNDDVCTICKKMVKEARDQLESNETVEELKEVFEGSCKLIYLKPAVRICKKLADDFVPELVDTISSQMNPDVVCTVAGLCNNAEIDKMIEDAAKKKAKDEERNKELQAHCSSCMDFADAVKNRIDKASADDLKMYLLERCRSLGSYTDACSNIMISYFDTIYDRLKNRFTSRGFCHVTASCTGSFSRRVQVKTESDAGVVHLNDDALSVAVKHLSDDETCDLCKQLVKHLKDILIADTTEIEFKQVLEGICKQTGKFKDECSALVDQYYAEIYRFIANDINGKEICGLVGICPGPGRVYVNGPIWPLLPMQPVPINEKLTGNDELHVGRVSVSKNDAKIHVIEAKRPMKVEIAYGDALDAKKTQLPIERIYIPHHADLTVNNKQACVFCQYVLHYIQKVITQPYGENEIKTVLGKVCSEMPQSVSVECKNFVDMYGDAFVAILAQEIDPSQVCPSLHICPAIELENRYEPTELQGKPGCPLCLMAVEELTEKLKDNKTEESIREELGKLCNRLPKSLKGQCDDLVKQYTDEMIDMIIADFTPQEVCTYLKLCPSSIDVELLPPEKYERLDLLTNEIPQTDEEDTKLALVQKSGSPVCVLCEFIMSKIEDSLRNNATEEDIRRTVLHICRALPSTIRPDCNKFMDKYGDTIVKLLIELTEPKVVCSMLDLCFGSKGDFEQVKKAVQECAICEALVGAVDALLEDNQIDRNLSNFVSKICKTLPANKEEQCKEMLVAYGPSIINLLVDLGARPSIVCWKMGLCDKSQQMKVTVSELDQGGPQRELIGGNRCTWGPSYWCQSEKHANSCGTLAHCREMVWKSDAPKQ